jgi:hypothetical protein
MIFGVVWPAVNGLSCIDEPPAPGRGANVRLLTNTRRHPFTVARRRTDIRTRAVSQMIPFRAGQVEQSQQSQQALRKARLLL